MIETKNGKGLCPQYDGNCDVNRPCTSQCKRDHKKMSNRKRRQWNKKVIKIEVNNENNN